MIALQRRVGEAHTASTVFRLLIPDGESQSEHFVQCVHFAGSSLNPSACSRAAFSGLLLTPLTSLCCFNHECSPDSAFEQELRGRVHRRAPHFNDRCALLARVAFVSDDSFEVLLRLRAAACGVSQTFVLPSALLALA